MRATLAKLRPSGEARIAAATPSAQDRMDLRFIAGSTPGGSLRFSEDERTEVAPGPQRPAPAAPRVPPPSVPRAAAPLPAPPVPAPAPRRAPTWAILAAVACVAIAAFAFLTLRARPDARDRSAVVAPPVAPAPPTSAPAPTGAPTPEPTAVPTEPAPTPQAAARVAPTKPVHREVAARVAPHVERVDPAPAVTAHANPTVAVPAMPPEAARIPATESAEAVRPPAPASHPTATDADRIRETVRLYETAQNTLNPEMYLRAFPGVDRSRIEEAFRSFRSQSVEFEIRRIDLDPRGTTAEVTGFETRVAVPKAGNDLRVNAQRVLRLEKRGDAWVIIAIQ
jgi:hypothetical protein